MGNFINYIKRFYKKDEKIQCIVCYRILDCKCINEKNISIDKRSCYQYGYPYSEIQKVFDTVKLVHICSYGCRMHQTFADLLG